MPAYEFAFDDVNPPVHALAVLEVWRHTGCRNNRDNAFLARCFQKLMLNFTWLATLNKYNLKLIVKHLLSSLIDIHLRAFLNC